MRRLALTAAGLLLAVAPVEAGVGVICGDGTDPVHVHIPLAGGVGLGALGATLQVEGRIWSTDGLEGAEAITPAQVMATDSRFYFDFTDPNYEGVVARVRLFRAQEDDLLAGLLEVAGVGAWPIACGMG